MLHDGNGGSIGERLAEDGRVLMLSTRGRVSGQSVRAAVGFVEEPDGSLLVAAGSPSAHWARNLTAHPFVTVARAGRSGSYQAEELEGDEFAAAISALILRYGTPAERLGRGPAFRLRPRAGEEGQPADDERPTDGPPKARVGTETREHYVERMIREAQERGEFKNLPSHGRPLPRPAGPGAGEWELAFSMLRNAAMAPPWIEADKEWRRLRAERDTLLERARHASPVSHESYRERLRTLVSTHIRATEALNGAAPSARFHRRPLILQVEMAALERILDQTPAQTSPQASPQAARPDRPRRHGS